MGSEQGPSLPRPAASHTLCRTLPFPGKSEEVSPAYPDVFQSNI